MKLPGIIAWWLTTLGCLSTYSMEPDEKPDSLYTLICQDQQHIQEAISEYTKKIIIPFHVHSSFLIKDRKALSLEPETPGQSFSINYFKLPFRRDIHAPEETYISDSMFEHQQYPIVEQLILQNYKPQDPTWRPDIKKIFFEGTNNNQIGVINVQMTDRDLLITFSEHNNDIISDKINNPNFLLFTLENSEIPYSVASYALCHTRNFILVDLIHSNSKQRELHLHDISSDNTVSLAKYTSKIFSKSSPFKHLAFLTPATYIGITTSNKLYIIEKYKQRFKFRRQTINMLVEEIAVNRHDPHKLLLMNTDKELYYANLHGLSAQKPIIYYKRIGKGPCNSTTIHYDNDYFCIRDLKNPETVHLYQLQEVSTCTTDTPEQDDPST